MARASSQARGLIVVGVLLLAGLAPALGCGRSPLDVEDFPPVPDGAAGAGATGGAGGSGASGGAGGLGAAGGVGGAGGIGAAGGVGGIGAAGGVGGDGGIGGLGGFGGGGVGGVGGAPGCGPCSGCCDATGVCRSGDEVSACGKGGVQCFDCGSIGFGCSAGQCEGPPPKCGPGTCSGCCDSSGLCHLGGEQDACGLGGVSCVNCTATGQGCVTGQCAGTPPSCGPGNCSGCCDAAGTCQPGNTNASCGADGVGCATCQSPKTCWQSGSYCAYIPTCGPLTCPSGCCDAKGLCQNGKTNAACGSNGGACSDCSTSGLNCAPQGFCYSGQHCGPDTCAGCCDATGQCHPGSGNLNCGQYGGLCQNCSTQGKSCVGQVCSNGSTCPAAYSGCAPNAATPPPATSVVCSNLELGAIGTACKGSGTQPSCGAAFGKLLAADPACYDCLIQFSTDKAYARCLAPFLGASCNHDLTCALDCSNIACGQCSGAQQNTCQSNVFDSNGECRPYVDGYFCAQAALSGPGAFCDFSSNDVGAWIQAVGAHYCGGK